MSQVEDREVSLPINLTAGSEILPVQLTASSLVSEATEYLRERQFAEPIGTIINKAIREAQEANEKPNVGLVLYQVSQGLLAEKALDADRYTASSALLRRAFMYVDTGLIATVRANVNGQAQIVWEGPWKLNIAREALTVVYPGVAESFGEDLKEDEQDLLKRWLGDYKSSIIDMRQYCENYTIEQWRSVDPNYKAASILIAQARLVS